MKIASISGVTYKVKDIKKTVDFYSDLGLRLGEQDTEGLTVYVNWFWIRFQVTSDEAEVQDSRMQLNLKVVDVDEFYNEAIAKGFAPVAPPQDQPWGHREFILRDPDGHTLVFFEKTK